MLFPFRKFLFYRGFGNCEIQVWKISKIDYFFAPQRE
jgi:hypothetical protein